MMHKLLSRKFRLMCVFMNGAGAAGCLNFSVKKGGFAEKFNFGLLYNQLNKLNFNGCIAQQGLGVHQDGLCC